MYKFNEYLILEGKQFTKSECAILFTDMVESSKLWAKNEKEMLDIIIEQEKRIHKIVDNNKGLIVKSIGDAFMVKFDDLKSGIQTAIDIQDDLNKNPLEIGERLVKLRIGICYGNVWTKENDIQGHKMQDFYGNTVNSASRLESKVSDVDGFAFASIGKMDDNDIKGLLENYDVKVIDYKSNDVKEYKRSGRLLTDSHHYLVKSLDELKGINPITAYSCIKK